MQIQIRKTAMLLLGLDLETGGEFNASSRNFITEIGLVLWDTDFNQPVALYSALVDYGIPVSEESREYTGISDELLRRHGIKPDMNLLNPVKALFEKADYIVAHNGRSFDRPLMDAFFSELGEEMPQKDWIDTLVDVDYPRNCKSRNLTYLAGFHGILNSFPHRAVTDVLTMLTILSRYDIETVIANAFQPRLAIRAEVGYSEREKAKQKRFSWESAGKDGLKYAKSWVRIIRESELESVKGECDFPIVVIERLKPAASA